MKEIKGFSILPVQIESSIHYIYYKKHEGKNSDNKSIFTFNLPILTNLLIIKKFYQEIAIGAIVESFIDSKLSNYIEDSWVNLSKLTSDLIKDDDDDDLIIPKNCGIISFIDSSSFNLAFNNMKKLNKQPQWPIQEYGSSYMLKKYQQEILDKENLINEVSTELEIFNNLEKESIAQLQQQTQLVDEDGFTLVVGKHSKTKAGILGKQKFINKVENEKKIQKQKKKEHSDFYKFQLRQQKKEEMNQLLTKFKQDQQKIEKMKQKKRFKPY
ncbi:unnamed protein product [Candida verbasci]|uniref:Ribosomal RNA-processing protein 7 C-terminal domain-containing protein n=1 Tax=Candida verbasci TaxID=1227364 RepID=A0A9W4X8T3_9ASCO|nr:unnamed protein product [Candida verbasci]